jgi:hypothetical protein
MKRLHVHVSVPDIEAAIGFYSRLFATQPCCGGATYANWRIQEPALNFAASTGHAPRGTVHLGLEVETSDDLRNVDRVLHDPLRSSAAVPWEVAVRKRPIRKEPAS